MKKKLNFAVISQLVTLVCLNLIFFTSGHTEELLWILVDFNGSVAIVLISLWIDWPLIQRILRAQAFIRIRRKARQVEETLKIIKTL